MPLTSNTRFYLIQRLKTAYSTDIGNLIQRAGLAPGDFTLQGRALDIWTGIVARAESTRRSTDNSAKPLETKLDLEILLQHIIEKENPTDEIIKQALEELKNNYTTKLKLLAKSIKAGQCVLFLGPKVLLTLQGGIQKSFNDVLAEVIVNQFTEDTYYDISQVDNLNYVAQQYSKMEGYVAGDQGRLARELYEQLKGEETLDTKAYEKLAELPFRYIINTNPDDQLATIINEMKPDSCVVRHYDPARIEQADEQPPLPVNKTLIYNLLGTMADPVSVQMTESQLIKFTSRIVSGKPPLDRQVRLAFNENTYYLFLGFDFDQWYMKLVLDMVLELVKQKGGRAFSTFSANAPFSAFNREFYQDEFKFYFIDEDVQKFVKLLVDYYKII